MVKFEWNENKNKTNIARRGLDFNDAAQMFNSLLVIEIDNRINYGEDRYERLGVVNSRLMIVIYTRRAPDIVRIISYRKANKREQTQFKKKVPNRLGTS
jgi:uncharacterized DUF497 family protein